VTEPLFVTMPTTVPHRLNVAPRLASWNARGDEEQKRLDHYLDYATALVEEPLARQTGDVAVRLDVYVPENIDLLDQRDLDNYLFPLAFRLHRQKHSVKSWWATKSHQHPSLIRVGPADAAPVPDAVINAATTASSESEKYKEQVRDAVSVAPPLPEGPVALEIAFTVGTTRNWLNLWKPTIDALGPLLGTTDPTRHWHPRDGRITQLGLHRQVDPALGNAVRLAISALALDTTVLDRQDEGAYHSGGPVDEIFDLVRRARPEIGIERLQVAHPVDADGLWYFRVSAKRNVQIESGQDGQPPFLVEGGEAGQRMTTDDPHEAADAVIHWL
jgi:hypothetical protein